MKVLILFFHKQLMHQFPNVNQISLQSTAYFVFFPSTQLSEYTGNSITTNNSPNEKLYSWTVYRRLRCLRDWLLTTSPPLQLLLVRTAREEGSLPDITFPQSHKATLKSRIPLQRFCHLQGESSGQTQDKSQKNSTNYSWVKWGIQANSNSKQHW